MVEREEQRRRSFLSNRDGATVVEYALITAMIAVSLMATYDALSADMGSVFTTVDKKLEEKHAR